MDPADEKKCRRNRKNLNFSRRPLTGAEGAVKMKWGIHEALGSDYGGCIGTPASRLSEKRPGPQRWPGASRAFARKVSLRSAAGRGESSGDLPESRGRARRLTLWQRHREHALTNLGHHCRVVETAAEPQPELVVALGTFEVQRLPVDAD